MKYNKSLIKIGFVSNIFEWYDFSIYAYLAVIIGEHFFPSSDDYIAIIKVFLLFAISYLIRPIGSIFFGRIADKYSRSLVLKISLIIMAIPTFLICILPTYAQVGMIATFSMVILRLLQGFAAGGELPISACYMYESAPSDRKSFYCSFVAASSMTGVLVGSVIVTILYYILGDKLMMQWGWRIPFLLGFIGIIFVFYIRKDIVEPQRNNSKYIRTKKCISSHKLSMLQVVLLNAFISISFYLLFVWMPSYLHVFLMIPSKFAFVSSSVSLLLLICFTLLFGYLAPKIGRKNLAILSIISIMLLAYPAFQLLKHGNFLLVVIAQIIFALCLSFIDGINMEMMGSRFKDYFRGRGISIGFTLSTAVFGGTAPVICSYLIHTTGSDLSPIIFLIVACIIALPFALTLKNH
ncbi:MFS transporter [Thiotrichales bacterium 19X7-9]|nr:MFS transporter [Thiotrichales bacterium 19X7-9]